MVIRWAFPVNKRYSFSFLWVVGLWFLLKTGETKHCVFFQLKVFNALNVWRTLNPRTNKGTCPICSICLILSALSYIEHLNTQAQEVLEFGGVAFLNEGGQMGGPTSVSWLGHESLIGIFSSCLASAWPNIRDCLCLFLGVWSCLEPNSDQRKLLKPAPGPSLGGSKVLS